MTALSKQAARNLSPLICRLYFLDGKAKAMGVSPSSTARDVIKTLAEKIELQSVEGWALYEVSRQTQSHSASYIKPLIHTRGYIHSFKLYWVKS